MFLDAPLDGILGLGPQSRAVNNDTSPFINAIQQGIVSPLFTIYLDTAGNTEEDSPAGGTLNLGGLDTANCGDVIDWVPFSNAAVWSVQVDNCTVGDVNISTGATVAVTDTGSSMLVV